MKTSSKTLRLKPIKINQIISYSEEKPNNILERNPFNSTEREYKPINKTKFDNSIYKTNFDRVYVKPWKQDWASKGPEEIRDSYKPIPDLIQKPDYGLKVRDQDKYNFDELKHMKNVKMLHARRYKEQEQQWRGVYYKQKNEQNRCLQSAIVDGSEYRKLRRSMGDITEVATQAFANLSNIDSARDNHVQSSRMLPETQRDKINIYRRNLHPISSTQDINKDFGTKKFVRNTQQEERGGVKAPSRDAPYWLQQNIDKFENQTQEQKEANKAKHLFEGNGKLDILGKPKQARPKVEKTFEAVLPSKAQLHETKRMVIVDKIQRNKSDVNDVKGMSKQSSVPMVWKEDIKKQPYDKNITEKVGNTDQPVIKRVRMPSEDVLFRKIGEQKRAPRDLSETKYEIKKIGHLDEKYTKFSKKRDDGSYDKFRDVPKSFEANLRMSVIQ